jgi:pyruvate formate lyase activating enzyme
MRIGGFQPCSLLDFPGKIAAIVFMQGCPFACGYCHNPELIPMKEGSLSEDNVLHMLTERRTFLDGVVITGGEPTVQPDLPEFIEKLRKLGLEVKLDTNGVHPCVVEGLIKKDLVNFFAMDIKNPFEKYENIVGNIPQKVKENCEQTMRIIARSGVPYELRTTTDPVLHTQEDILSIVRLLPAEARYALQGVRRQKTLKELPDTHESTDDFLRACQEKILEERPDIHLLIR